MIETDENLWSMLKTSPMAGWLMSITTTTMGAFNFDNFTLASINSILGAISMFVGICLSLAMLRAWVLKGDLHEMDKRDRNDRRVDNGRRVDDDAD